MTETREESHEFIRRECQGIQSQKENNVWDGGWKTIYGERRFFPIGYKKLKIVHCKSCLYHRKSYGGYCELDPQAFINPESEACEGYINRNLSCEKKVRHQRRQRSGTEETEEGEEE